MRYGVDFEFYNPTYISWIKRRRKCVVIYKHVLWALCGFQKWYEFPKPLLALRCVNIQEAIKEAFDALTDTRITPYSHSFFKDITCSTTISRMSVHSELSQTFFVNSLRKDASDVLHFIRIEDDIYARNRNSRASRFSQ